jgi:hypothetical protein
LYFSIAAAEVAWLDCGDSRGCTHRHARIAASRNVRLTTIAGDGLIAVAEVAVLSNGE